MSQRHVLFLCSDFAPLTSVGRIRPQKFCKFLPEFGWRTSVLTLEPPQGSVVDLELLAEVPAGTAVHRVGCPQPFEAPVRWASRVAGWLRQHQTSTGTLAGCSPQLEVCPTHGSSARHRGLFDRVSGAIDRCKRGLTRHLLVPDEGITAVPGMIRQAVRVIREQGVDVLLVTVPGFSPWLAGVVASMQTGVPLVVDYRDLWHGDVLRKWIGPMRTRMELAVERWCLRRSAAVVTVSEGKTRYIRELDGAGSSKTLATIYNGFDPEDIEGISPDRPHADAHRCLLLYTGRLYRDRRIDPLVSAIGRLVQAGSVQRDEIRLRTLGLIDGDQQARIDRLVADFGLQAVVETRGYVTRSAALAQQLGADAVVLVVDPGETSDGVLPGKITEYVGLGKFVLALCPPGEARNILERYGHAASADALDQDSLDKAVLGLIDRWRTDPALLRERRINAILPTRRDNAAALAGILDTVLEGANSKCSGSIANLAVPAV